MPITHAEWKTLTSKSGHSRSSELKEVDKALLNLETAINGRKSQNEQKAALDTLARAFGLWVSLKKDPAVTGGPTGSLYDVSLQGMTTIRNRKVDSAGERPVQRLKDYIYQLGTNFSSAPSPAPTTATQPASAQRPAGGVAVLPVIPAQIVLRHQTSPTVKMGVEKHVDQALVLPLTFDDAATRATTEAFHNCRTALQAAKSEVQKAASSTLYRKWFGDPSLSLETVRRCIARLDNMIRIGPVTILDGRSDPNWGTFFGWATPGSAAGQGTAVTFTVAQAFFPRTRIQVSATASKQQKQMEIGRAIAASGNQLADAQVGTIIHELSHARNDLPDVYIATATVNSPPGRYHASKRYDPNNPQCSTPELAERLALEAPALAKDNADNYGQFCREIFLRSIG